MQALNQTLYLISDSLLIPVVLFLLLLFARALMLTGALFRMFLQRSKQRPAAVRLVETFRTDPPGPDAAFPPLPPPDTPFGRHLAFLAANRRGEVNARKALDDLELEGERELEKSKVLIRTGPMLGLMGTLIPMGPALVSLAAGNLESMAQNMRIAFSSTVVGIFVGGIGFLTHLVKRRWYLEDARDLGYVAGRLREKERGQ